MYRRKYWMVYWRDFANTYDLYYTDDLHDEEALMGMDNCGIDRVTRKEAIAMARENRRNVNAGVEQFAPTEIHHIATAFFECYAPDGIEWTDDGILFEPREDLWKYTAHCG